MSDRRLVIEIEGDLLRTRALLAGLRLMTDGAGRLSEEEQDAVFIVICEAENAADHAVEAWRRFDRKTGGRDG